MKVLLICKKFPYPPKDGETIAIFNHVKGFSEAGHQVTVASINTPKHHVNIKELPKEVLQIADFHAVDVDTSPKPFQAFLNLFQKESYHIARFVSKAFEDKLQDILASSRFDVIQLEGLYLAPYVSLIRKYSKSPVVMRAHNVEHEIWERISEETPSRIKKWYFRLQANRLKKFELSMLNRYDAIIPITARDGKLFNSLGCKLPMFVSPAGVDIKDYKIDRSILEFPSVFFLGGLDWIPNQEGLIWFIEKVWKRVTEMHQGGKFYIAGRNAPNWIKALKEKKVEVIGEVENAKVFMNSKAIMVVPLFAGSGMRIKIIEGMAMGKTIISTSIGAEGIDYSHGENILIANSSEEFISSLDKCMNDREYSLRIGANATDFIHEHYGNKNLAGSLLKFYAELNTK